VLAFCFAEFFITVDFILGSQPGCLLHKQYGKNKNPPVYQPGDSYG